MSLRPRARGIVVALAVVLIALGTWAVVDDPKIENVFFEAASVQCRSVAGGTGSIVAPTDQDPDEVLGLDDDDVVHEDADALDEPDLSSLPTTDDEDASDEARVVAYLRETARECDAARTHRLFLAGLAGLPAMLLLGVALVARHDDSPRPPRRRFVTVDPAFRS